MIAIRKNHRESHGMCVGCSMGSGCRAESELTIKMAFLLRLASSSCSIT